eukprot:562871-Prymnesium_polylepis.1
MERHLCFQRVGKGRAAGGECAVARVRRSKNLEYAKEEAAHNLAERARLEMDQKAAVAEVKRETDLLNRSSKEYNASLKKCKRAEMQLQASQNQVPFMRRQLEEASRQVAALKDEKKKQLAAVEDLKREVDIFINQFLKQESVEKEKQEWLRQLFEDIKALEEELVEAYQEEQAQRKTVSKLTGEREAMAREAAKQASARHPNLALVAHIPRDALRICALGGSPCCTDRTILQHPARRRSARSVTPSGFLH